MTDDGRLAVTKRAGAGPGADRLRREADILRRAAHPGVVELLTVGDLDGGAVLHTAFVGGGTLAEHLGPLDQTTPPDTTKTPDAVRGAQVAAALAATLADLHDRGIAHQRVTADHVLVTDIDQVRLCGLAGATMSSEPGPCDPENAAVDVDALAALMREMAAATTGTSTALRAVADRVLLADPSARPSMRTLAQALAALTDEDGASTPPVTQGRKLLPARPSAAIRRRRPTNRRTAVALLLIVAVLVTSAAVATTVVGPNPSSPSVAPSPVPVPPDVDQRSTTTVAVTTSVSVTPEPTGVRVWPPDPEPEVVTEDCPPSTSPESVGTADIDGDGCAEVVAVADGVVFVLGRRWQVASPGDLVVVGDWDCDGLSTPAVVRPDTGDIWTFSHWADQDEEVAAAAEKPAAAGAVSAEAVAASSDIDDRDCHDLELTDTTGTTSRIDLRPS